MPDGPPEGLVPVFRLLGGSGPRPTTPTAFVRLLGAIKMHQEYLVAYGSSGGLMKEWVALGRARIRLETTIDILGCQGEVLVSSLEVEGARVIPEWYAELRHAAQVEGQGESNRGTD